MIDLDDLAQAASCLDPLPASVTRLATIVCDPDVDLNEVAAIAEVDMALTATLLRAANSAWSASRVEVTTVRDAVVRLGAGTVLTLAMGVNVKGRLNQSVPEYGLSEGMLWRHAVAASVAAEVISKTARVKLPRETVTAALLHDVGKLVMARFLSEDLLATIEKAHRDAGISRMAAEYEVLGVHHAELGGLIVQIWGLPASLVRGICYHHTPTAVDDPIAFGVYLSDAVAKEIGAGLDDNAEVETFAAAMGELGVSADGYDEIVGVARERFDDVLARYEG